MSEDLDYRARLEDFVHDFKDRFHCDTLIVRRIALFAKRLQDLHASNLVPTELAAREHSVCTEIESCVGCLTPVYSPREDKNYRWSFAVGGLYDGDSTELYLIPPNCGEPEAIPVPTPARRPPQMLHGFDDFVDIFDRFMRSWGQQVEHQKTATEVQIENEMNNYRLSDDAARLLFGIDHISGDMAREEPKPVRSIDHLRQKEQKQKRKARRGR
jgi:hypothetical protein